MADDTTDLPPIEPLEPGEIQISDSAQLRTTTLGELGDNLAHGLLGQGQRLTGYSFKPPTMGTRKRLGALRFRRPGGPGT